MAKKRTLKPYYGKLNQRLEQRGKIAALTGDHKTAKEFFDMSDEVLTKRRHAARGGR